MWPLCGATVADAPVPDPRFRDQLAEALTEGDNGSPDGWGFAKGNPVIQDIADHLLPLVEARVQAAANQREVEAATDALMWAAWTVEHSPGIKHQARAVTAIRARAAALASPAPAPRAEAGR